MGKKLTPVDLGDAVIRGKKIVWTTQSLANGGTYDCAALNLGTVDYAWANAKVADHMANVEAISGTTITITLIDFSTVGTPAFQSSAKDIMILAIGDPKS